MDAEVTDPDPGPRLAARHGTRFILGVDEVGRGPLAGPVVTGAVVLELGAEFPVVADSKQLSAAQRQALLEPIRALARGHAVAEASVMEIDATDILTATLAAMRRAVMAAWRQAGKPACVVLVDGRDVIPSLAELPQVPVIDGDARNPAIAAASILAKEHRDALMADLHVQHPQYGFDRHKGYGTGDHVEALRMHGPSPHHRRTFEPIRTFIARGTWPQVAEARASEHVEAS